MKCRYPTTVHRKDEQKIPVKYRCGKCMPCLITRGSIWTGRILMEQRMHLQSAFFTLTYTEDHLPKDSHLSVPDAQKFIKRLRKHVHPRKIRHIVVGEYGTLKERPHLHGIIFGIGSEELISILPIVWKLGSVEPNRFKPFGDLTVKNARYLARYVTKKLHSEKLNGRPKEFQIQSRLPAIGDLYIHQIANIYKGSGLAPAHLLNKVPSTFQDYTSNIRGTYSKFNTGTIRIGGKKYLTGPRFNEIMLRALGAEEKQIEYEREIALARMEEEPICLDDLKAAERLAWREQKRVNYAL